MKTIRQQLQSRVSKRRNFIYYMEMQKVQRRETIKAVADFIDVTELRGQLYQLKAELKALHSDQALDKRLYAMLVELDRENAQWKEFWDSMPTLELESAEEHF